jgi:hypothetical protein
VDIACPQVNVRFGSFADIEVCIINVCFALRGLHHQCLLCPQKQTFSITVFVSASCQKQTWNRQRAQSLDAGFDHDRRREQDAAVMIPCFSVDYCVPIRWQLTGQPSGALTATIRGRSR